MKLMDQAECQLVGELRFRLYRGYDSTFGFGLETFCMSQLDLQRLARLGAAARLTELERERTELLRMFPGLRAGRTAEAAPAERRGMSAANRRAVSIRMKRYWAKRRAEKAKGARA